MPSRPDQKAPARAAEGELERLGPLDLELARRMDAIAGPAAVLADQGAPILSLCEARAAGRGTGG